MSETNLDCNKVPSGLSKEDASSLEKKSRMNWLPAPEVFALDQACSIVNGAFGEMSYLVGSATEKREFRDVDVRMIFSDEKWEALFGTLPNAEHTELWSVLCTAISEYLAKRTGLKIDFQFQKRSKVSEADWKKKRVPLSLYINEEKYQPNWKSK